MSATVSTRVARYPFLQEATEAVEARVEGFDDLVGDAVLDRAVDRVRSAVRHNVVGDVVSSPRVELYSYPVARAVVSVVDEHALTRKYAWGEAATAFERMKEDVNSTTSFGSVGVARLEFDDVVREFGLELREGDDGYLMPVETYLRYGSKMSGEEWKLVNRAVEDGWVQVDRLDVLEMARRAVLDRVSDGLPLDVPADVEELVAPAVEEVRELVATADLSDEIDVVQEPDFPPCMKALLADVRDGRHLEHHSRFAITAFLTNIGMSTEEIVDTYEVNPGFGEEMTRYQTDHIRGETSPTQYSCPSCATMVTYGDCRNRDELCDSINHPLAYYRRKLEDSEGAEDDEGEGEGEGDVEERKREGEGERET